MPPTDSRCVPCASIPPHPRPWRAQVIKPIVMGSMPSVPSGETVRAEAVTAPTTSSTAGAPAMAGAADIVSETCNRLAGGAIGAGSSGLSSGLTSAGVGAALAGMTGSKSGGAGLAGSRTGHSAGLGATGGSHM